MDATICPICMETLRTPRSISCSHTFCHICLNDHINASCQRKDFPMGFHCPVCRKFIPGSISSDNPSLWAESFPKNAMIEFMIQGANDHAFKFCKPCLNGHKEEPASTLCRSCMECFCKGCTDHHKKLTITKEHEVVPFEELNKSFFLEQEDDYHCCKHDFRNIDLFCYDHSTSCCSECSITEHKTCKMDTIEKAFENIEKDNESQDMLSEINRVASHFQRLNDIQRENQTKIEDKADEIRSVASKMKQEINEKLDKLETELLEDLSEGMKSTRKAIAGNIETFSDLLELSIYCQEFLTNPSKKSCYHGYVGGFHRIKKQLKRLKSAKLHVKDAEINATFSNAITEVKSSKQLASLHVNVKENPISLNNLDFQSVPKGIAQEKKKVFDILNDRTEINDILYFENGADLLVCLDDKTSLVWDTSGISRKSYKFRFTILRAVMISGKIYAISDKENFYAIELLEGSITHTCTKLNSNRRCFGVSVFQDSLIVGCKNAILHIDTNGKEKKCIPAEGRVVDSICLTTGNIIYIGRTKMNRKVKAIDENGKEIWHYEHSELNNVEGLTKDCRENIYITGSSSHNIHMLSSGGYALKIFEHISYPSRMILKKESNDEFYVVSNWISVKQIKLKW